MPTSRPPTPHPVHCPACGKTMDAIPTADPFAVCLSCSSQHRFFILPDPPGAAESACAATLTVPVSSETAPFAVAEYWLSNPIARSVLNSQLAEILRSLVDGWRLASELEVERCPHCAGILRALQPTDNWVSRAECQSGHEWFMRGGRIWEEREPHLELKSELSVALLDRLIIAWLTDPRLEPENQVHASIRSALQQFAFVRNLRR